MKTALLFWIVNFIPVSIALAIFEIWLEKHKRGPWGKTAFIDPRWEEKLDWSVPFLKHISKYHLVIFGFVLLPTFVVSMIGWSVILDYPLASSESSWFTGFISVITMLAAIWLGNSGLEDFFYFAIQSITGWREPHALRKVVIEKDFAWFKDWLPPVFGLNIPGHWLFCPVTSLVLLYIRHRWIMQ